MTAQKRPPPPATKPGRDYLLVFGAAVRRDGRPSLALRHRIEGALAWWRRHPGAMIVATGGVGRHGRAEAAVIAERLREAGVGGDRIVVEPCGRDTLESVRFCDRILRARGDCARIICCTSTFHQPRCALLLRLLGYRVVVPPMPHARAKLGRYRHARLVAKEVVATPYDALLHLARRALGSV